MRKLNERGEPHNPLPRSRPSGRSASSAAVAIPPKSGAARSRTARSGLGGAIGGPLRIARKVKNRLWGPI